MSDLLLGLCMCALLAGAALAQDWEELEREFSEPSSGSGILKIIHNFPKDAAQREALVQSLADQGFGGIACNVHFDDYMRSEENWEGFLHGISLARERGMRLWLYDEKGYPSGGAGGLTLEAYPEGRAEGLYISRAAGSGEAIEAPVPPGEVVFAVACPLGPEGVDLEGAVELTEAVSGDLLTWEPPAGEWEVFVFVRAELYEGTHSTANVFMKQAYINLLDPEATRVYIEVNHEQYAQRIEDLGAVFESTFTDEPSLMALFFSRQPYPAVPWWTGFPESFRGAKGYDLIPLLPALVADGGDLGHRARCDYWDHVGELVATGFFGQIADWCAGHGLPSGGHLLMEENLDEHVINYGDFYRCAELLDYPSIDCLTSVPEQVPWRTSKLLGSIAHLKGAPVVMSETSDHVQRYRPEGDTRPAIQVTADQIRGTCGLQFVTGVTTITSYYSYAGLTDQDLRDLNDWVARCELLLRATEPVADTGVLYPVESAWAAFTPANHGATSSQGVREINDAWQRVQAGLFESQRDFEVIDSRAIAEGRVESGVLRCGAMGLRSVVLPLTSTLRVEALERLVEFVESGGMVVLVGALPTDSLERRDDPRCREALARLLGEGFDVGGVRGDSYVVRPGPAGGGCVFVGRDLLPLAPRLFDGAVARDVEVSEGLEALRVTHRRKAGRELYFVVNSSGEAIQGRVTLAAAGEARVMAPETGATQSVATSEGPLTVELSLPPYGARAITVTEALPLAGPAPTAGSLALMTAPWSETVGDQARTGPGCGPHVTASTATEVLEGVEATLVRAEIGETGVDSWCFLGSPVAAAALGDWDGVRIPLHVPEGQEGSSPRFFAIAEMDGGAQYITPVSRALSEPGWDTVTVWWPEMAPMGGSEGLGPLDPSRIRSLSIGWGGYFGAAGEVIRFGLGPLELVRLGEVESGGATSNRS